MARQARRKSGPSIQARLHGWSRALQARMVMQLHDEAIWEVLEAHAGAAARVIRRTMEVIQLDDHPLPPMPTAVVCGRSWGQMEAL